ncbi:hypothetical protein [Nocardia terpenica]|uniref:Alpha/beta hydrolase n=1 Tax=Nocardia terpenica TaxID=455432 RepID=A0A6G9Z4B6_9NOCA|nr:hypothetical protein [Nocardia terpenica]QIS20378.1 hypothetical protein F6W96_20840 [Nocardia terpenica]
MVGNAIPEAIHRIVYISAFCPSTPEAPSAMASSQTLEPTQGISAPEALEDFRVTNMPEATLEQMLPVLNFGMQPEDSANTNFADARVVADTWGRTPSYIRLTRDNTISPALATKMIDDADRLTPDNFFDVHSLPAGHAGVALQARELAAILDKLA